jgi:hypothetical protein
MYDETIKLFDSNKSYSLSIESLLKISNFLTDLNDFKKRTQIIKYITKVVSQSEALSISDRVFEHLHSFLY